MTVAVANTSNTSTFHYWLSRTNELADAMSNKAVTVGSNAAVGNAEITGYMFLTGIIANSVSGGNTTVIAPVYVTSNVFIVDSNIITIGNSTSNAYLKRTELNISNTFIANTTKILLGSNITFTTNDLTIGNSTVNTYVNSSTITINGVIINTSSSAVALPEVAILSMNTRTTGTSAQIVDSFEIATYRAAEYMLTIKDNAANGHQVNKLLVLYDGSDASITDYGIIFSNTDLGTFTANANATHCRLLLTPTIANSQVKGSKTFIVL